MSYARFGPTSDVYVYEGRLETGAAVLVCCSCSIRHRWPCDPPRPGDDSVVAFTARAMGEHLVEHMAAGDQVPQYLIGAMIDPGAPGELLVVAEDAAKS